MAEVREIWKWELTEKGCSLHLPAHARVLSVGNESDKLMLWALVDPDSDKPQEPRRFRVVDTGEVFEAPRERWKFLGTVCFDGGRVQHVWETE